MTHYLLPLDFKDLDAIRSNKELAEDGAINMHDLHFPEGVDPVRAAIIYIRNMNIKFPMDFTQCTYEEKQQYITLYLFSKFMLDIPELTNTWIHILGVRHNINYGVMEAGSILTLEECDKFIHDNQEMVDKVMRLTISVPVGAIQNFMIQRNLITQEEADAIEHVSDGDINIGNYLHLTGNPDFIMLTSPLDGMAPAYYTEYFSGNNNFYAAKLAEALPYYEMMRVIFQNGGLDNSENFINAINDFMAIPQPEEDMIPQEEGESE